MMGYESMNQLRRWFLCALAGLVFMAGCGPALPRAPERATHPDGPPILDKIDASLTAAAHFLVQKQSPDGAWRSETYGVSRDGPSLTPYVLTALFFLPQGGERTRRAFHKGADYVRSLVGEDDRIRAESYGFPFPVYTAAIASWVVVLDGHNASHRRARAAWLSYLRERQLTEALGWSASDPEYGGWGYAVGIPRKPAPGETREPYIESNLSSTVYALGALRSAKVPPEDPVYYQILTFVNRCQNFSEDPATADPSFDDGGFFFEPIDSVKNKAGRAGQDRWGRTRFHSYGSMTADGLRALLHGGLPLTHPRVVAARRWLEHHFSVKTNPGTFASDREVFRESYYYYYCWSLSHALMHLGSRTIETKNGQVDWPTALATELMRRQRPDGSWSNRYTDAKEDDPLVATPAAAAALAICRRIIAGGGQAVFPLTIPTQKIMERFRHLCDLSAPSAPRR